MIFDCGWQLAEEPALHCAGTPYQARTSERKTAAREHCQATRGGRWVLLRLQRVFLGDKSASGCWSDGTVTTAGRRTLTESKTQRADWEGSCPRLPPPRPKLHPKDAG